VADKAGDALLLLLSLGGFHPDFYFISHSHLSCKRADQDEISRAADLTGPVRKAMALVLHPMTWFIASTWVNSLRLPIQNAGKPDGWVLQSILP